MMRRYHAIGLNTLRTCIEDIIEDFKDMQDVPMLTIVNSDDDEGEYSTYTIIATTRGRIRL